MNLADLAELAARQFSRPGGPGSQYLRPLPRLGMVRQQQPTSFEAAIYEPVIVVVLRGRKETVLGADSFPMGVGECLLVSHDLPVIARITRAPYLALVFDVDLDILRDLYDEIAATSTATTQSRS